MKKIKLITDSTCDLPKEVLKEYNIECMPLLINFGEKSYLDGVEINQDELFKKIESENMLPTTAQITPNRFLEVFNNAKNNDCNFNIFSYEWNLSISLFSKRNE